jgi:hypothetical protein
MFDEKSVFSPSFPCSLNVTLVVSSYPYSSEPNIPLQVGVFNVTCSDIGNYLLQYFANVKPVQCHFIHRHFHAC